jgi:hypothetical protein
MGNDEEDIPKGGSTVGASARQALWRAPGHQARLAFFWKYGGDGGLAGMNNVKNDDHCGEDANPQDSLPLLAGVETETPCCSICDH